MDSKWQPTFLLLVAVWLAAVGAERVHVRGAIHCPDRSNDAKMTVRLMEEDFSDVFLLNWFDSDDVLDETQVFYGEHFTLDGSEFELGNLEPYISVEHFCFGVTMTTRVDLPPTPEGGHTYRIGDVTLRPGPNMYTYD